MVLTSKSLTSESNPSLEMILNGLSSIQQGYTCPEATEEMGACPFAGKKGKLEVVPMVAGVVKEVRCIWNAMKHSTRSCHSSKRFIGGLSRVRTASEKAKTARPGPMSGSVFHLVRSFEIYYAEEAQALGIFNVVVADDELAERTHEIARSIADGPPIAIRYMKENLNRAMLADLKTCLAMEADRTVRCSRSDDHKEAVAAFLGKRKPQFSGR